MTFFTQQPKRVIRISFKKFVFVILIIIILAFGALFFLKNNPRVMYDMGVSTGSSGMGYASDIPRIPESSSEPSIAPDYYYRDYGQPNITDTREFLKTSYNAQIKSRDVADTVKDVKNAVRDAEGRIDSQSSSEKYGYISFVVSKSKFEDFRSAVESIGNAKLYTETISTQNLLGQKQNIEQQMESATTSLSKVEQSKKNLDAQHVRAVASFKSQIASLNDQLGLIAQEKMTSKNETRLAELNVLEQNLLNEMSKVVGQQKNESASYTTQANQIATQIEYWKKVVQGVNKQDTQFTNNIETVNGYVSIQWINVWELIEALSPVHPTIILIIIALIALVLGYRKGYIPKVEFV